MYCTKRPGKSTGPSMLTLVAASILAVVCSILVFSVPVVPAAGTPQTAPANPQFVQWLAEQEAALAVGESAVKTSADGHRLGYIPSPIDRSYLKGQTAASEASLGCGNLPLQL